MFKISLITFAYLPVGTSSRRVVINTILKKLLFPVLVINDDKTWETDGINTKLLFIVVKYLF